MSLPYPWQRLGGLAPLTLVAHHGGPMGWADHARRTVSLRDDLSGPERRCTLMHELLHLHNGPQPRGLRAKEEEQVRRSTARLMLPDLDALGAALAWSHSLDEAAEELGVDIYVLRKRLRHLSAAELRHLRLRLSDIA